MAVARRALFCIWCVLPLWGSQAVGCAPQDPEPDVPAEEWYDELQAAGTYSAEAELLDEMILTPADRASFARRALTSAEERVRVLGAVLASGLGDPEATRELTSTAVRDSSPRVRAVAWMSRFVAAIDLTADDREELLASPDDSVRAAYALYASDIEDLEHLAFDDSAVVRAFVARRIGSLIPVPAGGAPGDVLVLANGVRHQYVMDKLLHDQSALVRSSAITAARQLGYVPEAVFRGLVVDEEPAIDVAELVGDEAETRMLRGNAGLPSETDWDSMFLGLLIASQLWSPEVTGHILFTHARPMIGTVAADALIEDSIERGEVHAVTEYVEWVVDNTRDDELERQLTIVVNSVVTDGGARD